MRYFVNGCVHYAKKMKKNHYQLKSCLFFCIVLFFCESSQCEMKICGDNHGIFKTIKQLKMKTILNLKQYVILLVAAFAMTSCLDSDDPCDEAQHGVAQLPHLRGRTFRIICQAFITK